MNGEEQPLHCPLASYPLADFQPCPPEELDALAEWLALRESGAERREFPRGVFEDGRLDLCKQSLGPAGALRILQALRGHESVHSLLLGTDGLGDEGAQAVAETMRTNRALRTIYLGCNGITARGVDAVCTAIEEGSGTRALWLKRNRLGKEGAARVAAMLRRRHALRTLDLVNTAIGDEGAHLILSAMIDAPQGIERLHLGGNGLTATTAGMVAGLLAACPGLTALSLSTNSLHDEGAEKLAAAFPGNRTLRELSVAANGLSAQGATALAAALCGHPTLEVLELGSTLSAKVLSAPENAIGPAAAPALAALAKSLPRLRRLDLRANQLDSPAASQVLAAAEVRSGYGCIIRLEGNPCSRRVRKQAALLAAHATRYEEPEDLRAIRSTTR